MRTLLLRASADLCRRHGAVEAPAALSDALRVTLSRLGADDVTAATMVGSGPPAAGLATVPAAGPAAVPASVSASWRQEMPHLSQQLLATGAGVDVVHAQDLVSAAVALAAAREHGWSVVVRAHLTGLPMPPPVLWPVVLRAADAVVCPTAHDASLARRLGASPSRLVVCPDAALVAAQDCADLDVRPQGATGDPAGDTAPYLIGLSGVPAEEKTRRELLRALVRAPSARLVLLGPTDGERDRRLRTRFLRQAERAAIGPRLSVPGRVDRQVMSGLVRGAQGVVVTRTDPTSALAALVAMHCARPVVAVESAAVAEVQVDGVTGRVVPVDRLAAAVGEMLGDGFLQVSRGAAGLDRVHARYSAEGVGATVLSAYDRVA